MTWLFRYNPRMDGRRFLLILCVIALLGTTACTLFGEKKNASWSNVTSGEQLERLFWQDVKDKKWSSLEARMAPLLVAVNASRVFDKTATLEHVKSIDLHDFQIGEVETRPAGIDLIVTYTIAVNGTAGGQSLPKSPIRMMSVWQQLSKGWVLIAHSSIATKE